MRLRLHRFHFDFAQAANGLPAVNAGHGQVHQDDVRVVATGEQVQAVVAAGCRAQFEAQRLQQVHQQFAICFFVVHHQNTPARAGIGQARRDRGHLTSTRCNTGGSRGPVHLRQKELDLEDRSDTRCARDTEFAAHQIGQHLGNGEAQASARR